MHGNVYTARLNPSLGSTPVEVYSNALTDYLAHQRPVAAQVVFYDLLRRLFSIDTDNIDGVVARLAELENQKGNGSRLAHMIAPSYIKELMELKNEETAH